MKLNITYNINIDEKDFDLSIDVAGDLQDLSKEDYHKMVSAYLEAILPGRPDVLLPFLKKLSAKYPEIYDILSNEIESATPMINSTEVLKIFNE